METSIMAGRLWQAHGIPDPVVHVLLYAISIEVGVGIGAGGWGWSREMGHLLLMVRHDDHHHQ